MTTTIMALAVAATALTATNPNAWEEVDDDDGIRVWARDVPGSNIREVKAVCIVAAPAKRVWDVLRNTGKYKEFMPYILEISEVGKHANGTYEYQLIDPPMVDKRDYTLKVSLKVDEAKGLYKRSWVAGNEHGPKPKEDTVRVAINKGVWTVTSKATKQAKLEYYIFTDPGGSIPNWIANKANSTSVPALMNNVRQRSLDPNWTR